MLSLTFLCLVWTLNHRHCGRLKHIMTKWIQTHKSVLMGLHIISCIVTTRTSRPNVSRCCFERLVSVLSRTSGTDVSVSSRCSHSNISISSRSCHSEVSVSSESRDSDFSVSASYVSLTTLFCRPTRNCSIANRLHSKARLWLCMSKWRWISQPSKITIYKYWKKQNFQSLHCGTVSK